MNLHIINIGGLPTVELNGALEEKNGAKIPRFRTPKSVAAAERVKTEDR